jgi:lipopolysaccharide export system protein LptA
MRGQALLVIAMASLLAAPAWADNLKIEVTTQGVKVQEDRFSATATYISYDETKGLLILKGTEKSPVKFVFSNGKELKMAAPAITYQLKTGKYSVEISGGDQNHLPIE